MEMEMKKLIRSSFLSTLLIMTLSSCSLFGGTTTAAEVVQATPTIAPPTTVELTVTANPATLPAVNEVITYTFTVKNIGSVAVPGPASIATGAVCAEVNTIGNLDVNLDPGESVTCTLAYTVTQADLDADSVSNNAVATVGGINSNTVVTTVSTAPPAVLNLTKTAAPTTFNQTGQAIVYTYVIMNSGTAVLGPTQFSIKDPAFPNPINCGDAAAVIQPLNTLSCTAEYRITDADMGAGSVATSAVASAAGVADSPAVSATVTKEGTQAAAANPNLTVGSTVQHKVVKGEWLWQIARCYGADPAKTLLANPQLPDPAQISPDTIVSVPNIGSVGTIYGPPCIKTHVVQSGDTWDSIARAFNADVIVLQRVNRNTLTVGQTLTIPYNSAK
jgi:LysM repeat protein